jgi:hypothetical protein
MALYTKSGNAINLDGLHAYANDIVMPKLHSSFFQRSPIVTYMLGKMKTDADIGRPGSLGIVGGAGNFDSVEKANRAGSEIHVRFHTGKVGGTKWMGLRDTNPSTGNDSQDQKAKTGVSRLAVVKTPVKIWKSTLDAAADGNAIASAAKEALEEATEEHFEELTNALLVGNPTDQTADRWDKCLGIAQGIDTNNTYLNLDRTSDTYLNGIRITTAKSPTLRLIDEANITGDGTNGAADKGPGVDFVLMGKSNYEQLKQEALARGATISIEDMPGAAEVGVKYQVIRYGNVVITYDPNITGNESANDSDLTTFANSVFMLTTQDWEVVFHPSYNMNVTEWKYQGDVDGGPDCLTARIETGLQVICRRPWRQVLYTAVS